MTTTMKHKRSSVAGNAPDAADIETGELAINFPDAALYTKDGSGNIIELSITDAIKEPVKNVSGGSLSVGTVVYQSGTAGNSAEVQAASNSSASTMPALGIITSTLADEAEGYIVLIGKINHINTSSFSEGDTLYVGASGTLTTTVPSGEGALIQNIGKVLKVHASNGSIMVTGAGRTNATPNLNDGNIFIGNSSNQATTASFNTTVDAHLNTSTANANETLRWNGSDYEWADSAGLMTTYNFTATNNQTTFSGSDDNSATFGYTAGSLIVTVNGIVYEDGTDYTATNGTSVVFTSGLETDDEVNVVAFTVRDLTSINYSDINNTPTIPTNNNQLTNGAGYITSADGGNADTVDSLHASSFLRSDAFDTSSSGLYLQGGSYDAGTDTETAPLIIDEGDYIYTKDGGYLRKLIGKTASSDTIEIGQGGTSLIGQINLIPGNAGNSAVKINGNTVWNAGNDGSGSGLDADTVDGLDVHTGRNNEANKLVRTDGNGYIQAGWINTTSGATTTTLDRIYASNDGYIRYVTPATLGSQLGSHISYTDLTNKPTIPTNNNQLTNGAGYITSAPTPSKLSTATGSAPSYSARAWVNFNGSGTVSIRANGNVSSVTDYGTGYYGVNFSTAMPDANYAPVAMGKPTTSSYGQSFTTNTHQSHTQTASQVRIVNSFQDDNSNAVVYRDSAYMFLAVYR
jgi:hypothetical protein